jgi:hypothetical protein
MYYNDLNTYPATTTAGQQIASSGVVYMDIVPKPPLPADGDCQGSTIYTYTARTINGTVNGSYTLMYCLGSPTGGITKGVQSATPSGIAQAGQIQ